MAKSTTCTRKTPKKGKTMKRLVTQMFQLTAGNASSPPLLPPGRPPDLSSKMIDGHRETISVDVTENRSATTTQARKRNQLQARNQIRNRGQAGRNGRRHGMQKCPHNRDPNPEDDGDSSSNETESPTPSARALKRADKNRRSRADSIESAELHEAAACSMKDLRNSTE
ncbi:hypothetical protein B0H13DRAFT_1880389 [Mycena leptocephala]|nr:hypothetical protein B0H13DRAFT_1880389 [Mycena leptocephala]